MGEKISEEPKFSFRKNECPYNIGTLKPKELALIIEDKHGTIRRLTSVMQSLGVKTRHFSEITDAYNKTIGEDNGGIQFPKATIENLKQTEMVDIIKTQARMIGQIWEILRAKHSEEESNTTSPIDNTPKTTKPKTRIALEF